MAFGGSTGKLGRSLKVGGVNKTKYQARLMQLKHTQRIVMTKIVLTAKELKNGLSIEMKATTEVESGISRLLEDMGGAAKRFKLIADEIREGSATRRRGDLKSRVGGGLKGTSRKQLKQFKIDNGKLETEVEKVGNAVKEDERTLKRVLVLIELLRLLVRHYLKIDEDIKQHTAKESRIEVKEARRITKETNEAVENAAKDGAYEHALGEKVEGT